MHIGAGDEYVRILNIQKRTDKIRIHVSRPYPYKPVIMSITAIEKHLKDFRFVVIVA
jgi:hypothetical protein